MVDSKSTSEEVKSGSLVCVGVGMTLGVHLGPRARSHIEQSDVVFLAVSDPLVELWVQGMNADVRSLQPFYAIGKSRTESYREMVDAIMAEVRSGRRVCGAFYGHPGVFAQVPHQAVQTARSEGFEAVMEAGVSAEDCLYADLGIDPGTWGCQHYEATQFLLFERRFDPSAYLVLWQIGVVGDRSASQVSSALVARELLMEVLAAEYPLDHELIAYEAATLPISAPNVSRMCLRDLPRAELSTATTLVVPPCRPMRRNRAVRARLESAAPGPAPSGSD